MGQAAEKISNPRHLNTSHRFRPNKESKPLFFQPQLTVGPTDDVYEREADAVADKVMRMDDHEQIQTKISPIVVQPKCAACEEEERAQRKDDGTKDDQSTAPSIVSDALGSGGNPLDNSSRSFMESRFGYDFSKVKVHTDTVAGKSAQSINALAYTNDNNIVFNEGQYSPQTHSGKKLLAHELTHVVQQGGASQNKIQREPSDGCREMRRVVVDLLSFRGSNRNPYSDLAAANRIYRPCCVEFVPGIGRSVNPPFSDPLMGNDTNFDRGACGTDTAEEQALIPAVTSAFGLSGRIRVFYFESITPSARATSQPQYCSTPLALNHVYMTNDAEDRTLAHEMGHIFLNGFFHDLPADNLMHPTNTATGSNLTPDQCTTIRGNI